MLETLKAKAKEQKAHLKQYDGHFDDCVLGYVTRDVKHRGRVLVARGPVLVFPKTAKTIDDGINCINVWSLENALETSIRRKDVKF